MTASLLDTMIERLGVAPHRPLYTFLDRHGRETDEADCAEVVRRAAGTADLLGAAGVEPGDRVLLIFPPDDGPGFVAGFFGCMLLGAIAVPVASPDPRHLDRELPKLRHIVEDSGARVALTHARYRALTTLASVRDIVTGRLRGRETSSWPALTWLLANRAKRAAPPAAAARLARAARDFGPDHVVYLQYTSGSTSAPKGVVIRHRNLSHNLELIARDTRVDGESVLVGWVPLFHDMGLAGGILNAMHTGARCVAFSALSFLAAPRLWLEAIDRYRGTHIAGPNFGYEYLLRGLGVDDTYDLSSLRATLQGGEPMLAATMDRVEAALTPRRFDPASFANVYGMAESVLFISGPVGRRPTLLRADRTVLDRDGVVVPASPHAPAVTLVGSGVPDAGLGVSVLAVDPVTRRPRPPRAVGELWVSSASVSTGYWGRGDAENAAVFGARLAAEDERRFLRTGDLGFLGEDGEVFVCGRLKDLIIVGGRNIHPQDLENAVVAADPILRPGSAVAFGVRVDGAERVVVAAEVRKKALASPVPVERAVAAIRAAAVAHSGVQCHEVLLLRPGRLPKTTSGKLQRGECKRQWADGSLHTSALVEPGSRAAQHGEEPPGDYLLWLLRSEVAALLRLSGPDDVPVDLPLRDAGLDSLGLMDLAKRVEDRTGGRVPPASVDGGSTVRELAALVGRRHETAPSGHPADAGDVRFSPGQVHALRLGQGDWWNRAALLDVHAPLTEDRLRRAMSALVARHDALRLRLRREDGRFSQRYGDVEDSFVVESVTVGGPDELLAVMNDQHHRLSRENGPVMRLVLIGPATRQRLFLTVNHFVMDGVTLGILVDELDQLCRLDERGEPLRLARTSARFADFTRWADHFARGDAAADRDFWLAQLDVPPPAGYDSRVHGSLRQKEITEVRHYLSPDETAVLRGVRMDGRRSPLATTLLAALVRTAQRQWNCGPLAIRLSSTGRQTAVHGLDLSRTAGNIHCTFPLAFADSSAQTPGETLTAVAERLTRVPSAGVSFEALAHLGDDPGLAGAPVPTLWFNFQGEAPTRSRSGLFAPRDVPLGDMWDPEGGLRQPPLYLECSVLEGATRLDWCYSARHLGWSAGELDDWTARFSAELHGLTTMPS